MRVTVIIAVVLLVVGVVWIGQGVGLIGGSFMTGEGFWAAAGAFLILTAGALLRGVQRERRQRAEMTGESATFTPATERQERTRVVPRSYLTHFRPPV